MKLSFGDIPNLLTNSLKLLGRHWYLYLILLVYLIVAGIVLGSIAFIGLSAISGFTFGSMISADNSGTTLNALFTGISIGIIFWLLILWSYVSGFLGGLGQMLKRAISTDKVLFQEYMLGVFQNGPRLFFGFIGFNIVLLIPVLWGLSHIVDLYRVFDLATMDSGWNSQLRDAIGIAHSGTVLWIIIIQVVISLLLGFWWIISICETRHFLTSFGKSIAFVLSNPLVNLSVLLVTGVGMIVISLFFAAIFGMSGSDAGIGSLIGMIIYLPFMFIFLLQVYDPRYRRVIAENRQTENEVPEIQNAQV